MATDNRPDLVSDNWPNKPSVTRADLDKNTVRVPVKDGIKVVNSVTKDKVKGR
jgi:hypothetical protein